MRLYDVGRLRAEDIEDVDGEDDDDVDDERDDNDDDDDGDDDVVAINGSDEGESLMCLGRDSRVRASNRLSLQGGLSGRNVGLGRSTLLYDIDILPSPQVALLNLHQPKQNWSTQPNYLTRWAPCRI